MKECKRCGRLKALSSFSNDKSRKDNKHPYCKDCHSTYWKEKRAGKAEVKEIARKANRKFVCSRRGLTLEQYKSLLTYQSGVCAICEEGCFQSLAIDHNHKTGVVRGLLCMKCNTGLGKFKTIQQLKKAIAYLEETNARGCLF